MCEDSRRGDLRAVRLTHNGKWGCGAVAAESIFRSTSCEFDISKWVADCRRIIGGNPFQLYLRFLGLAAPGFEVAPRKLAVGLCGREGNVPGLSGDVGRSRGSARSRSFTVSCERRSGARTLSARKRRGAGDKVPTASPRGGRVRTG